MQNQRVYKEVEKPFAHRMVELLRALELVRDARNHLMAGQVQHLATLSGQLRALLTERSGKTEPLLLACAKALGVPLNVYCMPDAATLLPGSLENGLILQISGFPISPHRQFEAQVELTFPEMIDRTFVRFKGNGYTARNIIDWYANKAGGAHYATRIPEDFAHLLSFRVAQLAPLANALIQLGEATLAAGRRLLKTLVDFEIHGIICVPQQEVSANQFLINAGYPDSSMEYGVFLNKQLHPGFYATGLQGTSIGVEADRLIDWSEPRYFQATLCINDDLSTTVELLFDGERVGRANAAEPLFVLSDPMNYETFHNRSLTGSKQDLTFGLAEVLMFGRELTRADTARMLLRGLERRADPELGVVVYTSGSYGYASRGTKDLKMKGQVRQTKASNLLASRAVQ